MKLTKVIINSVTVKDTDSVSDPKKIVGWEYFKDDNEISIIEIVAIKSIKDIVDFSNGDEIEVHSGWTTSTDKRFFYGFITKIETNGGLYTITAKNKMIQLVNKNVNHVYDSSIDASAGEVSEIAEDLIETYGGMTASVQASGTSDGVRIDEFKCKNTDIFERVKVLRDALGWDVFYDDDLDIVYFQPYGYVDSGKIITVGTEIISLPEWEVDDSEMINDLRVDGATIQTTITETGRIGTTAGYTTTGITLNYRPDSAEVLMDSSNPPTTQLIGGSKDASSGNEYYIDRENKKIVPAEGTTFTTDDYVIINYIWSAPSPVHLVNQASIDEFGIKQKKIELSDITSVSDAESRASNLLSERSYPAISAKKVRIRSVEAYIPNRGEKINIVDNISSEIGGVTYSGKYIVNTILYKFPSAYEEISIGQEISDNIDWQETVEQRLERLEEKTTGEEDILTELVSINNDSDKNFKKPVPRYRKVLTQDYTTADNTMIWDNPDYGIWDTDNWATDANPDGFDAETNSFVEQYENSYVEEFIDTDFKDATNTTATWASGSSSFTSGQIAQSESIDYNNGTITTATLTSTETSGSLEYFMNADGNITQFNTGVITGATYTTGNVGSYALNFSNLTSDKVTISNLLTTFQQTGTYSISCWVYQDVTGTNMNVWNFAGGGSNRHNLNINGTSIGFQRYNGVSYTGKKGTYAGTGGWHHIICINNAGVMSLYVDNVELTTSGNEYAVTSTGNILLIGYPNATTSGSQSIDGKIDEFLIYSKVLSLSDRTNLFNKTLVTDSLVAKYSFEEVSGVKAFDTSNWEKVTSGTAHTFEKSGTDLKWKASEKAGSTAEISKVEIGGYH